MFGLAPMVVFGAISLISLRIGDGRSSGLIGLLSGVSAAPGLLVVGAPFADDSRYQVAILASIPLWLLLGVIASQRATNRALASWRDYVRELTWLSIGVVMGATAALIAAAAVVGESLII